MTTGLIIGRFQPVHNGHIDLIRSALREHDCIKIAIGSAQYSRTKDNPFTFEERKAMIKAALAGEPIIIKALPDIHDSVRWAAYTKQVVGEFDTVYAGDNAYVADLLEQAGCAVMRGQRTPEVSATAIRQAMAGGAPWRHFVPPAAIDILDAIGAERIVREASLGR